MVIGRPTTRTVITVLVGVLFLCAVVGLIALTRCCGKLDSVDIGASLNPKSQSTTSGPGGAIGYFYTFMNEGLKWMRATDESARRNEPYNALLRGAYALEDLRNAKEYYLAIDKYGPTWGRQYAAVVDQVRRDGKTLMATIDSDLARLARVRQQMFPRLNPEDAFKVYLTPFPSGLTKPDPEVQVDVLAEMVARKRVSELLLTTIRSRTEKMYWLVRAGIGHEVLTAEVNWLAGLAPAEQQSQCGVLKEQVTHAETEVRSFLEGIGSQHYEDGQTFADLIRQERNSMSARMNYTRMLSVKGNAKQSVSQPTSCR